VEAVVEAVGVLRAEQGLRRGPAGVPGGGLDLELVDSGGREFGEFFVQHRVEELVEVGGGSPVEALEQEPVRPLIGGIR